MDTGFGRQQPHLLGGHVGRVGGQDVDASPQRDGQRLVKIALVHLASGAGKVAAGAPHRSRVEVGRVQLDRVQGHKQRDAHRARAAAQVDDDRRRPVRRLADASGGQPLGESDSLLDEELGAASGHEDTGVHGYPQAAEPRPAKDVLKGQAGGPPIHHGGKLVLGPRRAKEQPRLVLGEDTADGPQPGNDGGQR